MLFQTRHNGERLIVTLKHADNEIYLKNIFFLAYFSKLLLVFTFLSATLENISVDFAKTLAMSKSNEHVDNSCRFDILILYKSVYYFLLSESPNYLIYCIVAVP